MGYPHIGCATVSGHIGCWLFWISLECWVGACPVRVGRERVPSGLGGNVSRESWVGTRPVRVGWERVSSEFGENVSCQSWVGTCPVRVGWERVPSDPFRAFAWNGSPPNIKIISFLFSLGCWVGIRFAHRWNIGGSRANNVTIAATAARASFACESRKHNFHENLNISLDVCTFAIHLVL